MKHTNQSMTKQHICLLFNIPKIQQSQVTFQNNTKDIIKIQYDNTLKGKHKTEIT